jgi:uncharacterized protein with NRDE domain
VSLGKDKLQALLQGAYIPDHDGLCDLVGDRLPADPALLAHQGLGGEMDQLLSSQFITAGGYGTRSCTSMWYDNNGVCRWRELSFNAAGELCNTWQTRFARSG